MTHVRVRVKRREVHNAKTIQLRLSERAVRELDSICAAAGGVEYATMLRHLIRAQASREKR